MFNLFYINLTHHFLPSDSTNRVFINLMITCTHSVYSDKGVNDYTSIKSYFDDIDLHLEII